MRESRIFPTMLPNNFKSSLAYLQSRMGERLRLCFVCIIVMAILTPGCSHMNEGHQAKSTFEEANVLFNQGCYLASLNKYEQILVKYPATGDRALFEMGVVYSHPKNEQKDYRKAMECFQRLIKDYPASGYRQDSEMMIFYINNVAVKDALIASQQAQLETLRQDIASKGNEIAAQQKKIEALEKKFFAYAIQNGSTAEKILIEKKERRLMLISKGDVLKTYKIALGGNPIGPKERAGDNKTPEGCYVIDSRNKGSRYHLSLHVSYPNERDKKRAKQLGVSPGGDIMIHGIKNGLSWVGEYHAEVDWTKGCIAVTDEEIEEIARLAPNGTTVEIRP
ncbi:MAG: outer membrane protein assembly factor BamD [Deltaproteobacteria bacterium]|nr:outer membrane protein assembly factor BamD [Deltaproteobacteria bacterium]